MAAKPVLTDDEVKIILAGLEMAAKSYMRRVNAEKDEQARKFWQSKVDAVAAVSAKVRIG